MIDYQWYRNIGTKIIAVKKQGEKAVLGRSKERKKKVGLR